MDQGLRTQAAEKLFKCSAFTVTPRRDEEDRYIYELVSGGKPYILKGYKIFMESLESRNEDSKTRFMQAMKIIAEVYQEYFFAKAVCLFSVHFAKPLIIDYELKLAKDEASYSYLFIEIIFEHSGKSLDEFKSISVGEVYNLMRQSANALSLLHGIGITHFDIKPSNMVYNERDEILKVIDMGSSYVVDKTGKVYEPTVTLYGKLRSYTSHFAPPEILKLAEGDFNNTNFVPGAADAYSWAMCFYSMILQKTSSDLTVEIDKFKKGSESSYAKFMTLIEAKLKKVLVTESDDKKKIKIITDELLEALSFKPENRPTMLNLVTRMRDFEKTERIVIDYANAEKQHMKQIMKILRIEEDNKFEVKLDSKYSTKPLEEVKAELCKDCIAERNIKVELECGHKMCSSCTLKFIIEKFTKKESHKYKIVCYTCKVNVNLTAIIMGDTHKFPKWTNIGKKITKKAFTKITFEHQKYDCCTLYNSIDNYLINDYDCFNTEYLNMVDSLKKMAKPTESILPVYHIGVASAIAISNALQDKNSFIISSSKYRELEDQSIIIICNALQTNAKLAKLLLDNSRIRDTGAIGIGSMLQKNTSITELYLNNNLIGNKGMTAIGNALQVNTRLAKLFLENNNIGSEGIVAIGNALQTNTSLTELWLNHNQIKDVGATAIGNALQINKGLTKLLLEDNKIRDIGATAIGNALQTNGSLTELWLSHNKIGDIGATAIGNALQRNTSLTKLWLNDNKIEDKGAAVIGNALQTNKSLLNLSLETTKLQWNTAIAIGNALKTNKTINVLSLNNNISLEYEDKNIIAISNGLQMNVNLTVLLLSHNQIKDPGAIAIGDALQKNRNLSRLVLSNNQITGPGAIAIGNALKINTRLTELLLDNNDIEDTGAIAIGNALQKNRSLNILALSKNQIKDAGAIAIGNALQNNTSLTTLSLSNNKIGNAGAIAIGHALHTNRSLITLKLNWNEIKDEGAIAIGEALNNNKKLEMLLIRNVQITREGMSKIILIAGKNKNCCLA